MINYSGFYIINMQIKHKNTKGRLPEARGHRGEADDEEKEDEEEEEDAGDGVDDGGGGGVGDFVLGHRLPRRPPPTCLTASWPGSARWRWRWGWRWRCSWSFIWN